MSWGLASSSLFVVCKDTEQVKEIEKRFKPEKMDNGIFTLWINESEQLKIYFDLADGEVPSSFDDDVLAINQWLKDNFSLEISGSWSFEADGNWRCEVKDGEVVDAGLDWLAGYLRLAPWLDNFFLKDRDKDLWITISFGPRITSPEIAPIPRLIPQCRMNPLCIVFKYRDIYCISRYLPGGTPTSSRKRRTKYT